MNFNLQISNFGENFILIALNTVPSVKLVFVDSTLYTHALLLNIA